MDSESKESCTVWQLPNQTHVQMMSYVIQTAKGKLIVIDGGVSGDAPYLADFLRTRGGHVAIWFLTHPHRDHVHAPARILKEYPEVTVDTFAGSFCAAEWIRREGTAREYQDYVDFMDAFGEAERGIEAFKVGDCVDIDGVSIEVLGVRNPEITENPINNSSLVLRISDSSKSMLFLSDLGEEAGEKLLANTPAEKLQCDYVQMSHHGQQGVNEAFYRVVDPKYCLWPTPDWLWDNDDGNGPDSGPWKTLEVRKWMDDLSVEAHLVGFEGLIEIREKGEHRRITAHS